MKIFKFLFLCLLIILITTFFVSNIETVSLNLLPFSIVNQDFSFELPLFIVILLSLVIGLFFGYLFEFLRNSSRRRLAKKTFLSEKKLKSKINEIKKKDDDDLEFLNLLK